MTITITNRKGHTSIRATGKDANALFNAMVRSVEAADTRKQAANASNPVPNRPKEEIQGDTPAQTSKASEVPA